MVMSPLSIRSDYWETFSLSEKDLEYLYNHLLELETPQTTEELTSALIDERIRLEIDNLSSQKIMQGAIYLPKDHYKVGQSLSFPAMDWKKGKVVSVRPGHNPEYEEFEVIEVDFNQDGVKEYASGIEDHVLNNPVTVKLEDPLLDASYVAKKYGAKIHKQIEEILKANDDLVRIAWRWFPRALLVDVNIGHLNLAEAVLDMSGGGPLPTQDLLEQIELPTDVNSKLTEFSLNLALQEDGRFDEVGPAGEILWYLRRLEPKEVQTIPTYLKFNPTPYDHEKVTDLLMQMDRDVIDELEPYENEPVDEEQLTISLIFPHWRAGTLPLTGNMARFFPSAYEAPRVQFTFVDDDNDHKFSGWVVRTAHYIYGLQDWYATQNLIPGSLIHIKRGKNPGEVIVKADKRRSSREWIRTALIGADGGIVFAMLKQVVNSSFDERMAIAISDPSALDAMWQQGNRPKQNVEQTILIMMHELAKLNPQGNVHFQELYSAVNLIKRCPPGLALSILNSRPWANHLGNLYFKLEESKEESAKNE
jgi:hypothetical protein